MNTKKIIIALISLSIALSFTACANDGGTYSEERLAKEKENILTLLDSGKAKDIQKSIDRSIKFGLQSDLEIGGKIINLLDDYQSNNKTSNALLEYIADIPREEKDLLADELLTQYELAAKNGSKIIRDGIFQIIRFSTFSADEEKHETYDTWAFTKTNGYTLDVAKEDPELFNQLWVIAAKFGDITDIRFIIGSRNAHKEITTDTKIDLFIENINKIPTMLRDNAATCSQFEYALMNIDEFSNLIDNPENSLSQEHVDIVEQVLADDIYLQENHFSSCSYPSLDPLIVPTVILNFLELTDPQMTCNASMTFLDNIAKEDTTLNSRTDRWEGYLESAENSAVRQLIACEGETRDQFIRDYFLAHVKTNSYFANIALERELTAMGSTDHAQTLAVFIQSILDLDLGLKNSIYDELYGYFEIEENAPYELGLFIGPVIDDLYKLDSELGMETALRLLSNENLAGSYSEIDLTTGYEFDLDALENDQIADFFVQFITNNEIDIKEIEASQTDEIRADQTAYFRLMQTYRELNINKDEVIPFFAAFLEINDHYVRLRVARLLQNELEAGTDYFTGYFEKEDLAIIAGAYEYAYQILDEDILIEALNEYGDSSMANAYLNDHGAVLCDAAKTWANENGYQIMEFEIPTFEFD